MSESKQTLGMRAAERLNHEFAISIKDEDGRRCSVSPRKIAEIINEETAASEMLAILKLLLFDYIHLAEEENHLIPEYRQLNIDEARAAIAKAEKGK